jgi:hypothetical protein
MAKLAKVQFSVETLEAILTAKENDYVSTDCPQDIRIVRVVQDVEDQANHRIVLVLESEEADWPDIKITDASAEIPLVGPFTYTVEDPT